MQSSERGVLVTFEAMGRRLCAAVIVGALAPAWAQAQEPGGVRGPKPLTVTVIAAGASFEAQRIALDLEWSRDQLRTRARPLRPPSFGGPRHAAFDLRDSWREQTGRVSSWQARGIWWSGSAKAPRVGVEIVVEDVNAAPLDVRGDLARIAAIAVPGVWHRGS